MTTGHYIFMAVLLLEFTWLARGILKRLDRIADALEDDEDEDDPDDDEELPSDDGPLVCPPFKVPFSIADYPVSEAERSLPRPYEIVFGDPKKDGAT